MINILVPPLSFILLFIKVDLIKNVLGKFESSHGLLNPVGVYQINRLLIIDADRVNRMSGRDSCCAK